MNSLNKKLFSLILVVLVIGGLVWIIQKNKSVPVVSKLQTAPEFQEEGGETFHAVSIPALANKEFDGRDLTVGIVQAANESYTRYFITYISGDLKISGIMNVPKGAGP